MFKLEPVDTRPLDKILHFQRVNVGYEDMSGESICGCCRSHLVVSHDDIEDAKKEIEQELRIAQADALRQVIGLMDKRTMIRTSYPSFYQDLQSTLNDLEKLEGEK